MSFAILMAMTEMSKRFNFDDFDELCREALEDYKTTDSRMARETTELEAERKWSDHDKRPGEVGGVLVRLSFNTEPEPPTAA